MAGTAWRPRGYADGIDGDGLKALRDCCPGHVVTTFTDGRRPVCEICGHTLEPGERCNGQVTVFEVVW